MRLHFYKFQGTGNDFVLLDQRIHLMDLRKEHIAAICDRRFGVGADGLMILREDPGYDFRMIYYNSDGNESTMCGNGGRCMISFANQLGIVKQAARFVAIDGSHRGEILADGTISLQMNDVHEIFHEPGFDILNTGSPHYVKWVQELANYPVVAEGRNIRNQPEFQPSGINVNFVQRMEIGLFVRTYERGVEDETLSCGTGVTAAAIASTRDHTGRFEVEVHTPGGALKVNFEKQTAGSATNVVLTGPAKFVFEGFVEVDD